MEYTSFLKELLDLTFLEKASDLHLSVDRYPSLRITGRLVPLIKMKKISLSRFKFSYDFLKMKEICTHYRSRDLNFHFASKKLISQYLKFMVLPC